MFTIEDGKFEAFGELNHIVFPVDPIGQVPGLPGTHWYLLQNDQGETKSRLVIVTLAQVLLLCIDDVRVNSSN